MRASVRASKDSDEGSLLGELLNHCWGVGPLGSDHTRKMAEIVASVLQQLEKCEIADTVDLAITLNEDHQKVVGAVKSIQAFGDVRIVYLMNIEPNTRPYGIWFDYWNEPVVDNILI